MQILPAFIRLENSLAEALKYYNSPQMSTYSFAGVHLLPNYPYRYIQRTYANDGIEIEDFIVRVKSMCGDTLGTITDNFHIERNFNDEDTGLPQVEWSLDEVSDDFGYQLIYLEIQSGADGFTYSSPFMLTADRGEYTSAWFYRNNSEDTMLSIGIQTYFRQKKSSQELKNYNPVSTGVTYTATSRLTQYEKWNSEIIDINIIEQFKEIFLCREIYALPQNFDGLPVRTGLEEPIDSPDLEAGENFAEFEALFARNYKVTYDPNETPYVPPGPDPEAPFIDLSRVNRIDSNRVSYVFTYGNFSPTFLTYQFSLDGTNWSDSTGDSVSPHTVTVLNNDTNYYYYRIIDLISGTTSNVRQIPLPSLMINSVVNTGLRQYSVGYTLDGFEIALGRFLEFQASNNGTEWSKVITALNNNNPKHIELPWSIPEMDRIRIKYDSIISNTVMLPS